jgi:membrane protease YdiL (CAAX protease family)
VTFLVVNLLFTCIAEEAFFRGFLQDRLEKSLKYTRSGRIIAVFCSGLLFGMVHVSGGMQYMLLATLAGLGYASTYAIASRVEAPIIAHFSLNAIHFVGFTYPHVLRV